MKHRIRVAAIIVRDERVLLINHVDPVDGESFWVPPGGGLETIDSSLFECARREVLEEAGLTVTVDRIAYIMEFVDEPRSTHHLEIFVSGCAPDGDVTLRHLPSGEPDFEMIKDARWISRSEMKDIIVYPKELRDQFWDDRIKGFLETRYLGRQTKAAQPGATDNPGDAR
jgi:ADP-ribose pyrophosphatase YjhB (NUDIX family)